MYFTTIFPSKDDFPHWLLFPGLPRLLDSLASATHRAVGPFRTKNLLCRAGHGLDRVMGIGRGYSLSLLRLKNIVFGMFWGV